MSATAPAIPHAGERDRRAGARDRLRSIVRGRPADPVWVRPALLAIVALAAALCLWDLTISGYANGYYAAAVRSASESWKAWFFGALDPGSFITVDKPPLALWLMGLSARVFGFSSFSVLLPQALGTIAAVGLLYATVRRVFGPVAGLVAAAALAVSPITVAMARVDMPDALLVLLMVASGWLIVRAIETGRTKFLLWCGAVVGLAFMTKMLQGWMVAPALAAAYLLAGPPRLLVRIRQLLYAGVAMVAVSAAWPLAVSLWPAGSRPYIGGSTNGSVWNLIFGYNGFGRLTGAENGPGGGGAGGGGFGGASGLWRMFNEQVGGQIAWLLPFAAVSLAAGLWLTRRAPRTDLRRAGLMLFGVWAIVHIAVFSSQQGIFHPYYVSALAPAVAALTGAGVVALARWARTSWIGFAALAGALAATAWVAVTLLDRTPDFAPAVRIAIPVAAALAIAGVLALRLGLRARAVLAVAAVTGAVALAGGPVAYSVATVHRSLTSNNVLAGPASAGAGFGGGSGGPGGPPSGFGGPGGVRPSGAAAPTGPPPSGATSSSTAPSSGSGTAGANAARGGFGGGRDGASVSPSLIRYLEANQGSAKYLVAASGSMTTAPIIIQTGKAVVTIGGFNGADPAPTVSQLQAMVAKGELRYVLVSGGGAGGGAGGGRFAGRGGTSQALTTWVQQHGTAVKGVTTNGATLYRVSA
jgi:4-amino-4-deoxy-L-arabinose transferase-like glycosyltransferase